MTYSFVNNALIIEVITDMYNHVNPDLNTHAPIIATETYRTVVANADVKILFQRSFPIHLWTYLSLPFRN